MYIDCVYTCTSLYFAFCTLHMYDIIYIYIHIMYTYLTYMFYSSSYFLYMSCVNHVYTVNDPLWIYLKSNLYLLCSMHVLHCLRYYGTRLNQVLCLQCVFTLTSFSFTSVHLGKMTKQTPGEGVMGCHGVISYPGYLSYLKGKVPKEPNRGALHDWLVKSPLNLLVLIGPKGGRNYILETF